MFRFKERKKDLWERLLPLYKLIVGFYGVLMSFPLSSYFQRDILYSQAKFKSSVIYICWSFHA